MEEMMNTMEKMMNEALVNLAKAKGGNKSAAAKVRKFTLEMGNRIGKEYRKESVKPATK